ncbi:MAG: hypothetical protein ACI8TP_001861 [Acidimicrobiales bacterium]|jgi:hypothetical protein
MWLVLGRPVTMADGHGALLTDVVFQTGHEKLFRDSPGNLSILRSSVVTKPAGHERAPDSDDIPWNT